MRRRLVALLCCVVLAPALPFYFLNGLGVALISFSEWATEGRRWTLPFIRTAAWIERELGGELGVDDEYQAWRERMKVARTEIS